MRQPRAAATSAPCGDSATAAVRARAGERRSSTAAAAEQPARAAARSFAASSSSAPAEEIVPDGQFGPYGNFAPKTPHGDEDDDAEAAQENPSRPAVMPQAALEDMPQGRKRDVEEAELPEAPSRGGRDGPPEPKHPDEALWVKGGKKRAAAWLKGAPEADRRRFLDHLETVPATDPKFEAMLVQGQARKEKVWSRMDPPTKANYEEAAASQWAKWIDTESVEVLLEKESAELEEQRKRDGKGDYIMSTRWVLTDKNDPLRTEANDLPLKANARLVVNSGDPGRSDEKANVRVDAPCATTQSEMILTQVAASQPKWKFGSKDVSGAFLKGEVDERGLVIRAPMHGPSLADFPRGRMARVRKGVFGLPTAPRLW